MNTNYIDIERIQKLSFGDRNVSLYQKIIKLLEESGEVSEALEEYTKCPSLENAEEIVEENCDTINVAVDIINALNSNPNIEYYTINLDEMIDNKKVYLTQSINTLHIESGKVGQYFLRFDGAKNVSKSADNGSAPLFDQLFKVIQSANQSIQILIEGFDEDITSKFIQEMFTRKLDKWESKQKQYIEPNPGDKDYIPRGGFIGDIREVPRFGELVPGSMGGAQTHPEDLGGPDFYTSKIELDKEFAKEEIERISTKQASATQVIEVPVKPVELKINPNSKPKVIHVFPEKLYHKSGIELVPYIKDLIYRPNYVLKNNQKSFGVLGDWNVIVTWNGENYITEHPQDHFNNQVLREVL